MKSKNIQKFKLIDFNKLTIGEFVDLENYIKDIDANFERIASLIYRNNKKPEKNIYIFETWSYEVIYSGIKKYIKWREWLYDFYKALFRGDVSDEKTDLDEFNEKWSWYNILFKNFCNEDFFKMEEAFNINILEAMNHLGYLMENNQIEKLIHKK